MINEAHAQFDYDDAFTGTNDKYGPALELAGVGNFNRDRFLPSEIIARRTEILDNLSFQLGRHTLDVVAVGAADYWQGSFENHDGVDGGRSPAQAPPGEALWCTWPRRDRIGSSCSPMNSPPERVKCTPSPQRIEIPSTDGANPLPGETSPLRLKT